MSDDNVTPFRGKVENGVATIVDGNADAQPEITNVLAELNAMKLRWKSLVVVGTFDQNHTPFIMIGGVYDPHKLTGMLEDAKLAVLGSIVAAMEE